MTGTEKCHDLPGYDLQLNVYDVNGVEATDDAGQGDPDLWEYLYAVTVQDLDPGYIFDDARHWWMTRRTLLECAMLSIINAVTDKQGWQRKLTKDDIRARWMQEMRQVLQRAIIESLTTKEGPPSEGLVSSHQELVERAAQFCFEELKTKSGTLSVNGYTTVLGIGGADVIKSDSIVPEDLRTRLCELCTKLSQSQSVSHWHPGQENVVRNIVHPLMYPLHYGHTRILTDQRVTLETEKNLRGQGIVLRQPDKVDKYSIRFQWLPAEVQIYGDSACFTSYINNLEYEHHAPLYEALAELIPCAIPLWERCMATSRGQQPRRVPCDREKATYNIPASVEEPAPSTFTTVDGYTFEFSMGGAQFPRELVLRRQSEMWRETFRTPSCPAPVTFEEFNQQIPTNEPINLRRFHDLQIIVKMSNIELSPENPRTEGGSWHVEGLPNEHIAATAVYYYDSDNVRGGAIRFRAGAIMGRIRDQEQDRNRGLGRVYGTLLQAGKPAVQDLPTVATKQGRLLAFPNVFQHSVEPVELIDPSRPGHRKIIVLWLVNPRKRIISTANVPPQQPENPTAADWQRCRDVQVQLMAERSLPDMEAGRITRAYNFCEH